MYKRRGAGAVRRRRRTYRTRRRAKVSFKVKKAINRGVNRMIETLVASTQSDFNFNNGITAATDLHRIMPLIPRAGISSNAYRQGDKIHPTYMDVRGHIMVKAGYNTKIYKNSIGVRLMVVSLRHQRKGNEVDTAWFGKMLQRGNAVSGFDGHIEDLYTDLNKSILTVHYDKVFKLHPTISWVSGIPQVGGGENDKAVKMFRFRIKTPKVLHFVTDDNYPYNFAPQLLVGYAYLDGTVPNNDAECFIHWQSEIKYKDA